ncbi:MAG: Crp/Fnr family transcriptional regulator [Salinivirgaceae bacterium]|nr:Crp/Fnr family transcriptional regulator [Salinivirgaceae bacterium]
MQKQKFTSCTIGSYEKKCFSSLTETEVDLLYKNSVKISFAKGEVICKQGGLASHVLYIESGLVKVFIDDGVSTLVLKILPSCNLLGLASVSDKNKTFQHSAMAYLDSEIRQIDITVFKQLLFQNHLFAKEIIDILIENSAQINGRFFSLTHKQSYGRLADILLCLAEKIFKTNEFDLNLTRKEIAELTGISAETVVRMLKKFKSENIIQITGKSLKIIDYTRLKRISETG